MPKLAANGVHWYATFEHRIWLATPGKNGQPHKETKLRRIRPKQVGMPDGWIDQYLEAWEQFT